MTYVSRMDRLREQSARVRERFGLIVCFEPSTARVDRPFRLRSKDYHPKMTRWEKQVKGPCPVLKKFQTEEGLVAFIDSMHHQADEIVSLNTLLKTFDVPGSCGHMWGRQGLMFWYDEKGEPYRVTTKYFDRLKEAKVFVNELISQAQMALHDEDAEYTFA